MWTIEAEKRLFVPAQAVSAILVRSLFHGRPALARLLGPTLALTTEHTVFHNVCQPVDFYTKKGVTMTYRVYGVDSGIGKRLNLAKAPR
jgi:hypothetical protein